MEVTDFSWNPGEEYKIRVKIEENEISAVFNDQKRITYIDEENPYLEGGIGLTVEKGSHVSCKTIVIS